MPFHADDPLGATFNGDGEHWTLDRPLHWDDPDQEWTIEVPAGFETDFASVPRGAWNIFPPTGRYAPAAVLHDYLYWTQRVGDVAISRGYADGVLRRAAGELGVSRVARAILWAGVRAGGHWIWERYRKASDAGVAKKNA
jgi:hypothetical protein